MTDIGLGRQSSCLAPLEPRQWPRVGAERHTWGIRSAGGPPGSLSTSSTSCQGAALPHRPHIAMPRKNLAPTCKAHCGHMGAPTHQRDLQPLCTLCSHPEQQ